MQVHAHPDDEASKGAGTTARYAAEGVRNGDLLLDLVTEALGAVSPFRVRIETSPLGDEAVALGAVWMALQAAQDLLFTRTAAST